MTPIIKDSSKHFKDKIIITTLTQQQKNTHIQNTLTHKFPTTLKTTNQISTHHISKQNQSSKLNIPLLNNINTIRKIIQMFRINLTVCKVTAKKYQ